MRGIALRALVAMALWVPTAVQAYPVRVELREFADRQPGDLIVIDVHNVGRQNPVWFSRRDQAFSIAMIDNSIALIRSSLDAPGMLPQLALFPSLDVLHDLTENDGDARYDMRLYFDEQLLWVEVWPRNMPKSAVRSTVFFIGAPAIVYREYLSNKLPGVRYTNADAFKAAIAKDYAERFEPAMATRFLYDPGGWAAVIDATR